MDFDSEIGDNFLQEGLTLVGIQWVERSGIYQKRLNWMQHTLIAPINGRDTPLPMASNAVELEKPEKRTTPALTSHGVQIPLLLGHA